MGQLFSMTSIEKEHIKIYGYVYADSLEAAKFYISQDLGPGFELAHIEEKEYPLIIV